MTMDLIPAVDAAMIEMSNISPPLRRSDCERLIRAALAADRAARADRPAAEVGEPVAWLYTNPFYPDAKDVLKRRRPNAGYGWTETPLYAALSPQPASSPGDGEVRDEAITLAKDEGANFVLEHLAKALRLKEWWQQDGSEEWEGDVCATLMHILRESGTIDPETDEPAALLRPAIEAAAAERAREVDCMPEMLEAAHKLLNTLPRHWNGDAETELLELCNEIEEKRRALSTADLLRPEDAKINSTEEK